MNKRDVKWKPIEHSGENYRTEFQTPSEICNYMCSLIPSLARTVLEPTPGLGNLIKAIPDRCDIIAPNDFFSMKKTRFDCVVMNPPFSSKWAFNVPSDCTKYGMRLGYYILTECMGMSDHVIALMPWFTISDSDTRLRSLYRYGLKSVTALPRKTFAYARIQTVVLEMQKGWKEETKFKVFDCFNDKYKIDLF